MPVTRSVFRPQVLALALLLLPILPGVARAIMPDGVRPLSEAERQAAVLAAEYLDQGPAAWWDRLAAASPLRKLGREAALAEIEVRAGSPAGAEWELEAAPRGDLRRRRVHARLPLRGGRHPGARPGAGGRGPGRSTRCGSPPSRWRRRAARRPPRRLRDVRRRLRPPAGGALGDAAKLAKIPVWLFWPWRAGPALLLLVAAWTERDRRGLASGWGSPAGLIAAGALAARAPAPGAGGGTGRRRRRPGSGVAELRSLLPLRRALTEAEGACRRRRRRRPGGRRRRPGGPALVGPAPPGRDGPARRRRAPEGLPLAGRLPARRAAAGPRLLPAPRGGAHGPGLPARGGGRRGPRGAALRVRPGLPAARLPRARQAVPRPARHARRAPGGGLVRPGADQPCSTTSSPGRGRTSRTGWQLEPSPRAEICDRPLLTALLGGPPDPQAHPPRRRGGAGGGLRGGLRTGRSRVPAGFQARLLGATLRLDPRRERAAGARRLRPRPGRDAERSRGGLDAASAPRELLARLPTLLNAARTPGALAQPVVRQRTEDAAEALAGSGAGRTCWASPRASPAIPPACRPSLVRLRAEALRRSGREDEARDLLIRLAKGNTAQRRTDPGDPLRARQPALPAGELRRRHQAGGQGGLAAPLRGRAASTCASSRWRSAWRPPPRSTTARTSPSAIRRPGGRSSPPRPPASWRPSGPVSRAGSR